MESSWSPGVVEGSLGVQGVETASSWLQRFVVNRRRRRKRRIASRASLEACGGVQMELKVAVDVVDVADVAKPHLTNLRGVGGCGCRRCWR